MNLKNDNNYNGYDPSQNATTQGYDNQTFGGQQDYGGNGQGFGDQQNYGNQYGQPNYDGQNYGNQYGQPNYGGQPNYNGQNYNGQNYNQPYNQPIYTNPSTVSSNGLGMKWYKFIIYVQLFLSALSGLVNGIKYITGSVYGDASEREIIYEWFPSMKTVSTITGILMLAAAVVAIIARQKLAGFKHDGPMFYYITCGISIGASLIYCIAAYSELSKYSWLVDTSSYLAGSIIGILISVGLLIANIIYFGHRKDMFTN